MENIRDLVTEACGLLEQSRYVTDKATLVELEIIGAELSAALEDCHDDEAFDDGRAVESEITVTLRQVPTVPPERLAS